MNHKFIVKMEQGNLEQSYKIAEADLLDGVNSVFELLDEAFLQTVAARFAEMRKDFKDSYQRYNYWALLELINWRIVYYLTKTAVSKFNLANFNKKYY